MPGTSITYQGEEIGIVETVFRADPAASALDSVGIQAAIDAAPKTTEEATEAVKEKATQKATEKMLDLLN